MFTEHEPTLNFLGCPSFLSIGHNFTVYKMFANGVNVMTVSVDYMLVSQDL